MAALEAKNDVTEAENSNLRDLLSRLQEENLALKQAQFTFSVPKPAPLPASTPTSTAQPASFSFFGAPSPFPPPSAPSQTASNHSEYGTDIDWNSLTTFDPSMLSVLDEPEAPMQTDTSSSPFGQYALPQSYKTIANNPLLMSFVDESPSPTSFNTTSPANSLDHFSFNFSSPSNSHSWTSTAQTTPVAQNNGQTDFLHQNHSLDELFGGNYVGSQGSIDFNTLVDHTPMSPIASPPSASESMQSNGNTAACQPIVLSRTDIAKHILAEGPSPFTDLPNPTLHKTSDVSGGDIISCQGANVPRTKESPENIEVLKAWRSITQSPHFKVRVSLVRRYVFLNTSNDRMPISTSCVPSFQKRLDVTGKRWFWSPRAYNSCLSTSRNCNKYRRNDHNPIVQVHNRHGLEGVSDCLSCLVYSFRPRSFMCTYIYFFIRTHMSSCVSAV